MPATRDVIKGESSLANAALVSRLLDSVVAIDDGDWIPALGFFPFCFEISGITIATVQIRGSLAPTKPDNTDHGFQLGSDFTTSGNQSLTSLAPMRWVKARVEAWTSGTIIVDMVAEGND